MLHTESNTCWINTILHFSSSHYHKHFFGSIQLPGRLLHPSMSLYSSSSSSSSIPVADLTCLHLPSENARSSRSVTALQPCERTLPVVAHNIPTADLAHAYLWSEHAAYLITGCRGQGFFFRPVCNMGGVAGAFLKQGSCKRRTR